MNHGLCDLSPEWKLRVLWFLAGQKKVDANSMMESHECQNSWKEYPQISWVKSFSNVSFLPAPGSKSSACCGPSSYISSWFQIHPAIPVSFFSRQEQFENVGQGLVQQFLCFPAPSKCWVGKGRSDCLDLQESQVQALFPKLPSPAPPGSTGLPREPF